MTADNVRVTGYGGVVGGHFFVGEDSVTHTDYVAYSGAKTPV